jgi:hypothetical protein
MPALKRHRITTGTPDVTEYVVHWRSYCRTLQKVLTSAEVYADRDKMLRGIYGGAVSTVKRVIAYNAAEGWSTDVSLDVAEEIAKRFNTTGEYVEPEVRDFLEAFIGIEAVNELNTEED